MTATPPEELERVRAQYADLAREVDAFRQTSADTIRELLRVIDEQRAALDDATAAAASSAAMEAGTIGRVLRALQGVRQRVRHIRTVQRTRAARRRAASRVLAVPDAVRTSPVGLNVTGYINAESGMGEATRCSLRALQHAGVPFVLNNVQGPQRAADTSFTDFTRDHPYPFNLIHLNADNMTWIVADRGLEYFRSRYTIGYWFWELESFRDDFLPAFDLVDEVWVASEFTRACLVDQSPVPVLHVPLGITTPVPGPYGRAHFGLPEQPFIFLYTFDVSSHTERKNPMAALRAFRLAGFADDEAVLLLKFSNGHTDRAAIRRLQEAASGLRVIFLDGALSRAEVNALMACTDACLSLHRAEGFGMTIAEHMLLGKPAIASAYSGNVDFMTPDTACLVSTPRVPITRDYGPYLRGHLWGNPDAAEAAGHMRDLVRREGYAVRLGARGRDHVRQVLDPARTAALMTSRLHQIQQGHLRVTGIPPAAGTFSPSFT